MDWVPRSSTWKLNELGRIEDAQFAASVGSNNLGGNKNGGGFSVDFELGRLGKLVDESMNKLPDLKRSNMVSPSGSLKRKCALSGTQSLSCLVDGCMADLRSCREYNRRHRVCERHSKTPVVSVGGQEQRFCQQCSRFHSLGEFDEVKRSCRKRLDGHNRRRRKPQPEALYMRSFLSHGQGARLLQFSSLPAYATNTAGSSVVWTNFDNYEQQSHATVQQNSASNSFDCIYSGREKQFSFLLVNDTDKCNQAAHGKFFIPLQLPNTNASTTSVRSDLKSNKLTQLVESERALSLLSTHSTQTLRTGLSHVVHQDAIHLNQSLRTIPCSSGLIHQTEGIIDKPPGPFFIPDAMYVNDHGNGILHVSPDRLLENKASQLLSFFCK